MGGAGGVGGGAASAAATGAQATGARMESVAAPLGEEWEIPPPPALLEASGFGSEVQVAGMDPKAKTHWCKEFTLKAKQAGKEVVSKKIRLPICVRVHGAPEDTPVILCYISYYEGGRKNQMKCLEVDLEQNWRWIMYKALRMFKSIGGDEVPAFVNEWMADWEGDTTRRYGRGLKKEEVQVSSSDDDGTPLAQQPKKRKATASPSGTKKGKTPKPQAEEGIKLSSTSVEAVAAAVANQISEDMGQGVLDSIQGAIVGQSTSAVAGALKEARKSELQRQVASLEGKLKSSEDKVGKLTHLLRAERDSRQEAIAQKDNLHAQLLQSETERMRYKGERDALRVEVDALAVDKATLQANLTSALGGGALSPRSAAVGSGLSVTSPAMPEVLSTPVKQVVARKWPSSPHPPSQPPFSE